MHKLIFSGFYLVVGGYTLINHLRYVKSVCRFPTLWKCVPDNCWMRVSAKVRLCGLLFAAALAPRAYVCKWVYPSLGHDLMRASGHRGYKVVRSRPLTFIAGLGTETPQTLALLSDADGARARVRCRAHDTPIN
jgi:hypothetical protein